MTNNKDLITIQKDSLLTNMTSQHMDLNLELSDISLAFLVTVWCLGTCVHLTYIVLVFRLIYKKGPLSENPINVLILVDEMQWMVQLVHHSQMFICYTYEMSRSYMDKMVAFSCTYLCLLVFSAFFNLYLADWL